MNLDDLACFKSLDSTNLLAQIDSLPEQIEPAWARGEALPLPAPEGVTQVVLCGAGQAATAAQLFSNLVAHECRLPLHVCQTPEPPAWVQGPHTLVISFDIAGAGLRPAPADLRAVTDRGCRLMTIDPAGSAAQLLPTLLAAFARAGWVRDYAEEVAGAVAAVREQQKTLRAESPVRRNPAKRMAGQFMDRYVLVFGAGVLSAAARYWAERVQLYAKAWAQAEPLPYAVHTVAAGVQHPEALISKFMFITLECESLGPDDLALTRAAREHFMTSGFNTDFIRGVGPTPLAQLLTCLHYGDYVGWYLAMAYGVDPAAG